MCVECKKIWTSSDCPVYSLFDGGDSDLSGSFSNEMAIVLAVGSVSLCSSLCSVFSNVFLKLCHLQKSKQEFESLKLSFHEFV